MDKDQMAIYLSEHPEFFNDYPELLKTIKLIDKYNLVHLSTGDILRGEIIAGTDLGMEAKAIMDRGDLV